MTSSSEVWRWENEIAATFVGEITVFGMGLVTSDAAVNAYLDWVDSLVATGLGYHPATITLIRSTGPTTKQRAAMIQRTANLPPLARIATVSDSPLVRGAVTAFSWVYRVRGSTTQYGVYSFAEIDAALAWLAEKAKFDRMEAQTAVRLVARSIGAALR